MNLSQEIPVGALVWYYPDDEHPERHLLAKVRGITGGGRVQLDILTSGERKKATVSAKRIEQNQLEILPLPTE